MRVLAVKLANSFGHPTQVSTQVELAPTCDYLPVRLARALDSKTVLADNAYGTFIEMLNINEERKAVTRCYHSLLGAVNLMRPSAIRDSTPACIRYMHRHIGFSSTGEIVFSGNARGVSAWNVSSEKRIGRARDRCYLKARSPLVKGTLVSKCQQIWDLN